MSLLPKGGGAKLLSLWYGAHSSVTREGWDKRPSIRQQWHLSPFDLGGRCSLLGSLCKDMLERAGGIPWRDMSIEYHGVHFPNGD